MSFNPNCHTNKSSDVSHGLNQEVLMRDTWLEVDLGQVQENLYAIRQEVGSRVQTYAVLKANAYGLGLERVGQRLIELDVPLLAVATLSEALALRTIHESWPVLIMGPTPHRLMSIALEHHIQITLVQDEDLLVLEKLAKERHLVAQVQIKVDTGLHRVGFAPTQASLQSLTKILNQDWIEVKGVFSHLALANWQSDCLQLEGFLEFKQGLLKGGLNANTPFHISDSISGIAYPNFRLDAVRIGAALYGMKSYRYPDFNIKPVTRFMSRLAQIRTLEVGQGVGYDFEWVAVKPSVVATLPFGYADGYPREMKGRGYVLIRGQACPIIGVICMDQCMVDLTELDQLESVGVGEPVIVYGPGFDGEQTIADLATSCGSNKNDILTRVSQRVPRVYR